MSKKLDFDVCGGVCEACKEYAARDFSCQVVLSKRKVSTKFVPPDMSAIKLMMEKNDKNHDINNMSDEELENLEAELRVELFDKK